LLIKSRFLTAPSVRESHHNPERMQFQRMLMGAEPFQERQSERFKPAFYLETTPDWSHSRSALFRTIRAGAYIGVMRIVYLRGRWCGIELNIEATREQLHITVCVQSHFNETTVGLMCALLQRCAAGSIRPYHIQCRRGSDVSSYY
jgi:hypothetical protein